MKGITLPAPAADSLLHRLGRAARRRLARWTGDARAAPAVETDDHQDSIGTPVVETTAAAVAGAVARWYGLPVDAPPVHVARGVGRGVWAVSAGGADWIAKVFPAGTEGRVSAEVALYRRLNERGVRAPAVLAGKHGALVHLLQAHERPHPMILMRREGTREVIAATASEEDARRIGGKVAALHRALAEAVDRRRLYARLPLLRRPATGAYPVLAASPNARVLPPGRLDEIRRLEDRILERLGKQPLPAGLRETVLHGDLAPEHTLLLPGGEVYFLDFADLAWGAAAEDLAIFLLHAYRATAVPFPRWEALRRWLVEGYGQAAPLPEDDRGAVEHLMLRRVLDETRYVSAVAAQVKRPVHAVETDGLYALANYLLSPRAAGSGFREGGVALVDVEARAGRGPASTGFRTVSAPPD